MQSVRDILIYLAVKHQGNWEEIYNALKTKEKVDIIEVEKTIKKVGDHVLTCIDENYPKKLKNIYRPPFVLFYKGDIDLLNLLDHKYIAFVGSRDNTTYGKEATEKIINDLKLERVVIVSGLAKGIDGISHESSLNNRIKTIAVLGTGIDLCYPKENVFLYERISKEGLIISEYPFHVTENKSFPKRNRIIAGLSDGVVVCQAKQRSGTLITVNYALEQGKEVFSIPCSILDDSCCNTLIRDGAKIITCGKDILDEI